MSVIQQEGETESHHDDPRARHRRPPFQRLHLFELAFLHHLLLHLPLLHPADSFRYPEWDHVWQGEDAMQQDQQDRLEDEECVFLDGDVVYGEEDAMWGIRPGLRKASVG